MHGRPFAWLFLASFLATACGGGLDLTLVEAAHRRPSNVAVYFTVDTSDGDPVGGLVAEDFRIYEDDSLVSPDESKQTIVNPEVAAEHYTLLLVDMSGSVTESEQVPAIVQAATQFTTQVGEKQRVGVYAFDGADRIYEVQPFTESAGASARGVGRLESFRTRDPSTNLYGAIIRAVDVLERTLSRSHAALRFGTVVVFTDGTDRANRHTFDEMEDVVNESGLDIFAIGVGNELDASMLSSIGQSGYVLVQDADAISQAFQTIGTRILGYTNRYYLLSYCSPSRAGLHDVTIEAVTEQGSGDITYQFDAAGFGPNCNPESPPPFDTSGRERPTRRGTRRSGGSLTVQGEAEATIDIGAANPEGGDN